MTSQKLNRRQARWTLYLSQFNFGLKHVPGKSMGKANRLSRRQDWQEGVERDNENQKLVKPEWIKGAEIIVEEENLKNRIRKAQEGDEKVVIAVEELKKAGIKILRDEKWAIEDRIIMKEGRIYVPDVTNFIWSYLHQFFDNFHSLKASLKPLRRPFDRCQSRLEAINIGRDIKQIN